MKYRDMTLSQLREICQSRVNLPGESRLGFYLGRKISIFITILFDAMGIRNPNLVTLLSLISGIWGAYQFSQANFVLGASGFFGHFILDAVDGELSRLNKRQSLFGRYLDLVVSFVSVSLLLGGYHWGLYEKTGRPLFQFSAVAIAWLRLLDYASVQGGMYIMSSETSSNGTCHRWLKYFDYPFNVTGMCLFVIWCASLEKIWPWWGQVMEPYAMIQICVLTGLVLINSFWANGPSTRRVQ